MPLWKNSPDLSALHDFLFSCLLTSIVPSTLNSIAPEQCPRWKNLPWLECSTRLPLLLSLTLHLSYLPHSHALDEKTFPNLSALHDFLFSCLLLNIYHTFHTLNSIAPEPCPRRKNLPWLGALLDFHFSYLSFNIYHTFHTPMSSMKKAPLTWVLYMTSTSPVSYFTSIIPSTLSRPL
jgi:hypothetical protein